MAEYKGTLTELERIKCGKVSVVVSYWTNHNGTRFDSKLRFLVGDEDHPLNGLKYEQACEVREAINTLCDNWPGVPEEQPKAKAKTKAKAKAKPAATTETVTFDMGAALKQLADKEAPADKGAPSGKASNEDAAAAIARLMAQSLGA